MFSLCEYVEHITSASTILIKEQSLQNIDVLSLTNDELTEQLNKLEDEF